jgi:phenylacetate-coenzyme A ligase PaaK-like adenylate-forming protein
MARIVNMFPFAPHLAFWAATMAGFRTGRLMVPTGGGKVMGTGGNLRLITRIAPDTLIGTPGFVYHVLRQARSEGADLSSIKLVILGAEKVPAGLKSKMTDALGACGATEVVISGTYGFTEARMAFPECPTAPDVSSGYHTYPDLGLFEVVDPETGEQLGEGETGELVYSSLSGHGTTVFRYRTGDIAVGGILYEPCPHCGRSVPRISSELRRASERTSMSLTKVKGTLVDLSHIGTILSSHAELEEWQVVLSKRDNDPFGLDELTIRLTVRNGAQPERVEERLRSEIHEATEISPNYFEFHPLENMLALLGMETEMKEKRYLDERPS